MQLPFPSSPLSCGRGGARRPLRCAGRLRAVRRPCTRQEARPRPGAACVSLRSGISGDAQAHTQNINANLLALTIARLSRVGAARDLHVFRDGELLDDFVQLRREAGGRGRRKMTNSGITNPSSRLHVRLTHMHFEAIAAQLRRHVVRQLWGARKGVRKPMWTGR